MFVAASALDVDEAQKSRLESLARAGTTPQRIARKCRVILLASQGLPNHAIAQQTGLSRPAILAARAAFAVHGIEGINHSKKRKRSRRGLTPAVEQKILDTTLKTRPANATHRVEKFKISNDPQSAGASDA